MDRYSQLRRYCQLGATIIVIALASLFYSASVQAADSSLPVTAYQNVNFNGQSLSVGEGEVTIGELRLSVGNDRISSITIEPGYSVLACQNSGLRGRCEILTSDTSDLRTIAFNDVISSLSITKLADRSPVTVFKDVNFNGRFLSVGEGEVTIQQLRSSVGNDRISSITIDPGYSVLACQNSRLRGRCELFTSDTSDLRTISFNDVISSLSITKLADQPPVTVFQNVNFNGNSLAIEQEGDITIQDLRNSSVGNDVISSIRITDGYAVRACEHSREGGSGRCEIFTSSITDLRTIGFNDTISFLSVTRGSVTPDPEPEPNRAPVAEILVLRTTADTLAQFTIADLEALVTDADGDQLSISVEISNRDGNNLTQIGNTFTFDPRPLFADLPLRAEENVIFFYSVEDAEGAIDESAIIIVVEGSAPNTAPVTDNLLLQTTADAPVRFRFFDLALLTSDVERDRFDIEVQSSNADGNNLTQFGDQFTFDPTSLFADLPLGEEVDVVFTYTAEDTAGAIGTGNIIITVTGVAIAPEPNRAPVASDLLLQTAANVPVSFTFADLENLASDADGDDLSIAVQINGSVVSQVIDTFIFDPTSLFEDLPLGEEEIVVFTYTATDTAGAIATGDIIITVTGVAPRAPVVFEASVRVTEPDGDVIANVAISDAFSGEEFGVTDVNGNLVFEIPDAVGNMNLRLTADGYGSQITPLSIIDGAASAVLEITMIESELLNFPEFAEVGFGFEFNIGSSFDPIVSWDEDSFVTASNERISGFNIELEYTTIDVSNAAELEAFPGSFTGIEPDGVSTSIASLGTSEYVFVDRRDGSEVQLAENAEALISLPLYIDTHPATGEPINITDMLPIWSLDELTGVWVQETMGTVVASNSSPTGMAVEATVTHFSWWNIDVPIPTGDVTINVEGIGVDGTASVISSAADVAFRTGYGNVPIGGSFTTEIPANTEYCFSGVARLTSGESTSTSTVCATIASGSRTDITLNLIELEAPLDITTDVVPSNSGSVEVDGFAGAPLPRVRINPRSFESSVDYTATNLPAGISLVSTSSTAAELVGFPVNAGSFNVVVTGRNTDGETDSVSVQYEISADPAEFDITVILEAFLEEVDVSLNSNDIFASSETPVSWEFIGPTLPTGLSFDEARGLFFFPNGNDLFNSPPSTFNWVGQIRGTFSSGVVVEYNVTFIVR